MSSAQKQDSWLSRVLWWFSFFIATFALSKVFEATRNLTALGGVSLTAWFNWGAWVLLLSFNFLVLGYDAYRKAKLENKVARPIALFERLERVCTQGRA